MNLDGVYAARGVDLAEWSRPPGTDFLIAILSLIE
jgi:hypothetical protein